MDEYIALLRQIHESVIRKFLQKKSFVMILKEINPNAAVLPLAITPTLNGTITIKEAEELVDGDHVFETGAVADTRGNSRTNMSIQQAQQFVVEFEWKWQSGRFLDDSLTGGAWRVAALFEAMGSTTANPGANPSSDFNITGQTAYGSRINPVALPTPNGPVDRDYLVTLQINPDPTTNPIAPGLYRVSARAQYFDGGGKAAALSFFEDLGMIHVYSDGSSFV